MKFNSYKLCIAVLIVFMLLAGAASASGLYTNGLPLVGAPLQNGTTMAPPNGVVSNLSLRNSTVPVDTALANGTPPQTVSANVFQLAAATAAELVVNQQTSTVHAATSNTTSVLVTTETLSTAIGAKYTFTLTDSLVTATGAPVLVQVANGSNTTAGLVVTSVTNAAGSVVVVLTNLGAAALNGTILLAFHV